MGKDRSKDGDAATSSAEANKDHSWDQESRDTVLSRTIIESVAGALAKQKAEETQSITEAFTRQMEKTHAQSEKLLKETCTQALPPTLKVTSGTDSFRVMDPLTGQWAKTSTRDGSCGHTRLDLH